MKLTVILAMLTLASPALAAPPAQKLTFLVAHNSQVPAYQKAYEEFAADVKARSKGALEIEVKPMATEAKDEYTKFDQAREAVADGQAQLTQIGSRALTPVDERFFVFDLPYLFRDHPHAARVFDGPVGAELLEGLVKASGGKLRGLSFTYSGGFRVFVGPKKIETAAGFQGLRAYLPDTPAFAWRRAFEKEIGMQLLDEAALEKDRVEAIAKGQSDLFEEHVGAVGRVVRAVGLETSLRSLKHFLKTNHTLFLTSIVMNERALRRSSLPPTVSSSARRCTGSR